MQVSPARAEVLARGAVKPPEAAHPRRSRRRSLTEDGERGNLVQTPSGEHLIVFHILEMLDFFCTFIAMDRHDTKVKY